jgi:translation elongation factor EF-Ts
MSFYPELANLVAKIRENMSVRRGTAMNVQGIVGR